MKNHVVIAKAFQLGDEVSGQMEAHPLGVEKTEAAGATLQLRGWDTTPIFFFVFGTVASERRRIGVIVETLRLLEANALAELHAGKRFLDEIAERVVHGAVNDQNSAALRVKAHRT